MPTNTVSMMEVSPIFLHAIATSVENGNANCSASMIQSDGTSMVGGPQPGKSVLFFARFNLKGLQGNLKEAEWEKLTEMRDNLDQYVLDHPELGLPLPQTEE